MSSSTDAANAIWLWGGGIILPMIPAWFDLLRYDRAFWISMGICLIIQIHINDKE